MNIGAMRFQVTIQQLIGTLEPEGQETQTWQTFATRFAKIEPTSGREYVAAGGIFADVNTVITMRWIEGVTAKMRVVYGSHVYHVLAALNIEMQNRELQLLCVERPLAQTASESD